MSGLESDNLPGRPVPPHPDGSADATGGSLTLGLPDDHVESTDPELASSPVSAFPTIPLPPGGPPQRPSYLVSVPVLALFGLAVVAALAGLLVVSGLTPWSPAPGPFPPDGPEPGVGVVGTGDPRVPGAFDPEVGPGDGLGPDATLTVGSDHSPDPGAGPSASATSAASSSNEQPPGTGPAGIVISRFEPVSRVLGYRVTVVLSNDGDEPRTWGYVGVVVNGLDLLPARVAPTDVRLFLRSGRVCVAPTTSAAAIIDADESLTIIFDITVSTAKPGPAYLDDESGCAPAEP